MTRINTIHVKDLLDQHLMAEYREFPMVPKALSRSMRSKNGVRDIPAEYTLNTGHVKFFYNKKNFMVNRYSELITELLDRGYDLDLNRESSLHIFDSFDQHVDWEPGPIDKKINVVRICTRVKEKPHFYKMRGKPIDADNYVKELKEKYNAVLRNV